MTAPCILLIDDHAMFRSGLNMVISMAMPDAAVLQAASVEEALRQVTQTPAIVLLDIKLNGSSGLEGIASLKQQWPGVPVLMLSSQDEPETARLALARGAAAFVSKAETAEKIIEVIAQVLRGELTGSAQPRNDGDERRLTPRQREVLQLLHQGLSNKLIARKLDLSDNTVRRHVQDILEYFSAVNRSEAIFAARQQALVS
ncbi:MAG: response regulator transcription factor [Polaromonas sp.]